MSEDQTPSPTCLLLYHFHLASQRKSVQTLKLVNLDDEPDHHSFHHDPENDIDLETTFPNTTLALVGSANGLICMNEFERDIDSIHICNPKTGEYTTLPMAKGERKYPNLVNYGFGACPLTNQFKVVRIYQEQILEPDQDSSSYYKSEFQVYTLGTGMWRSAGQVMAVFGCRHYGLSLHEKLHWTAVEADGTELVCSFDLKDETLHTFPSAPPSILPENDWIRRSIGVLGNNLCLCDNTARTSLDVWVMKEYGNGGSWTKEMSIATGRSGISYEMVYLVKDFKDGEILFLFWEDILYSYNPKSNTMKIVDVCEANFTITLHVPSSISLETIVGSEQVKDIKVSKPTNC